jgi:hypothetical protein
MLLWSRDLSRVRQVRVELGIRREGVVVRIKLACYRLRGVDDEDVALFEVLHESMKILKIETTASVIAAELIFAFDGREGVHHD